MVVVFVFVFVFAQFEVWFSATSLLFYRHRSSESAVVVSDRDALEIRQLPRYIVDQSVFARVQLDANAQNVASSCWFRSLVGHDGIRWIIERVELTKPFTVFVPSRITRVQCNRCVTNWIPIPIYHSIHSAREWACTCDCVSGFR